MYSSPSAGSGRPFRPPVSLVRLHAVEDQDAVNDGPVLQIDRRSIPSASRRALPATASRRSAGFSPAPNFSVPMSISACQPVRSLPLKIAVNPSRASAGRHLVVPLGGLGGARQRRGRRRLLRPSATARRWLLWRRRRNGRRLALRPSAQNWQHGEDGHSERQQNGRSFHRMVLLERTRVGDGKTLASAGQTPSRPRCQSNPIAVRKARAIRADPVLLGCTRSQLIVAG